MFFSYVTDGIFSSLDSYLVPWKNAIDATLIDFEYFGNVSGGKVISPLVRKTLEEDDATVLSQERIDQIAEMLFALNGENWKKEWDTLFFDYNPISNYDMTETGTDTRERDATTHNTGTVGNVATQTDESGVYGFNSSSSVASDTGSTSGSNTRTDNLTATTDDDETIEHTLTRSGNIGVTTSQQMIESERKLYLWNYFYDVVFPTVDRVLTLPIY